jgi:hypothetical protein
MQEQEDATIRFITRPDLRTTLESGSTGANKKKNKKPKNKRKDNPWIINWLLHDRYKAGTPSLAITLHTGGLQEAYLASSYCMEW